MQCPRCRHATPPGSNFCLGCGVGERRGFRGLGHRRAHGTRQGRGRGALTGSPKSSGVHTTAQEPDGLGARRR